MVTETIPTQIKEGYWKFQWGGGPQKPKLFKESMKYSGDGDSTKMGLDTSQDTSI